MASYVLRLEESKSMLVMHIRFLFSLKFPKDPSKNLTIQKVQDISLICDNSVTTQNLWFFTRNV